MLSLRTNKKLFDIDLNGASPTARRLPDVPDLRRWSNMTVLPNGKVLVTGGSEKIGQIPTATYVAEIWDPETETWSRGASATKPRLYHSTALLLPDGTVLTAGGGAPGPVKNLNAEIYYPPYLYAKDGSGQPAPRPEVLDVSDTIDVGGTVSVTVATGTGVGRLTMVRLGAATHSYNPDQRFLDIPFQQTGDTLTGTLPSNPNVALPGYYMLFVIDADGVPSIARIIHLRSSQSSEPFSPDMPPAGAT